MWLKSHVTQILAPGFISKVNAYGFLTGVHPCLCQLYVYSVCHCPEHYGKHGYILQWIRISAEELLDFAKVLQTPSGDSTGYILKQLKNGS